jgi:hypothetical protein
VIEFFEGFALGLEVDIEREALVFGVVLVGVFVPEQAPGGGEFGDFGAAGTEKLENWIGFYLPGSVKVGVETEGGFVSGVDLGSPAPRGGVLLGD